eukprot:superscaffoldBa00013089_g25895
MTRSTLPLIWSGSGHDIAVLGKKKICLCFTTTPSSHRAVAVRASVSEEEQLQVK